MSRSGSQIIPAACLPESLWAPAFECSLRSTVKNIRNTSDTSSG